MNIRTIIMGCIALFALVWAYKSPLVPKYIDTYTLPRAYAQEDETLYQTQVAELTQQAGPNPPATRPATRALTATPVKPNPTPIPPTATKVVIVPFPTRTPTVYPYLTAIKNSSFEQGNVYWSQWSRKPGLLIFTNGLYSFSNRGYVHLGDYTNRSNETHRLWQTIKVPAYRKLSFYIRRVSYESICSYDSYYVKIGNSYLQHYYICNGDTGWLKYSFDISRYAGKTVTIEFGMFTNNTRLSFIYLDDVRFE